MKLQTLLLTLCVLVGCNRNASQNETTYIAFTEEQKIAGAKEQAQACNCVVKGELTE